MAALPTTFSGYGVTHVMIGACYHPLPFSACMLNFDLVSILFGASIPTSLNILVKMFINMYLVFLWTLSDICLISYMYNTSGDCIPALIFSLYAYSLFCLHSSSITELYIKAFLLLVLRIPDEEICTCVETLD